MNTLTEAEMTEIEGGNGLIILGLQAYKELLGKIEQNPGDYTWTMDWYYQRGQTK
jgi:hypothetical protein